MAGIAQIAKQLGYQVSGCDDNVYPPMSACLANSGIQIKQGYNPDHLEADTDLVIIGNVLSRGNLLIESILAKGLAYTSGPEWLHDHVLAKRKVIAIAGTHGKTTTASMVAWILFKAGLKPGYLIGGQPGNFTQTAELGASEWFVIEADEYDSAFFDKRSKFLHYHPQVAVLNNLEFDHGDIFDSIQDIKKQFHHLLRIVPSNGVVIANQDDPDILDVLDMGCWSPTKFISLLDHRADWFAETQTQDHSQFEVYNRQQKAGSVDWQCIGMHNMQNAISAIAASQAAGIEPNQSAASLGGFAPARRRLECILKTDSVYLYEDFAHHPTAIQATLEALKSKHAKSRMMAVIDPGSNTMSQGMHGNSLGQALNLADLSIFYLSQELAWDPNELDTKTAIHICRSREQVFEVLQLNLADNSVIICMGNRSFENLPIWLGEKFNPLT